jgi:hypothetical protein
LSDHSQDDRRAFGIDTGEVRHEPMAARGRLRGYVAALLLTPFVLLIGTTFWMTTEVYRNHSVYRHLVGTGYGMRLHGADCDVVVYGDSSALVGVDPAAIEQHTGLKTCNIAEIAGVQEVNGMIVPDTYLENNKRPRYMVFLYVPENLNDASKWTEVSTFEGIFFRLQMRPDRAFWKTMAKHPEAITAVAEGGLRTGVQGLFSRPPHVREQLQGRLPEPGPVLTECIPAFAVRAPDAGWIQHLRQRYGVGGTRVLVDVMPEPPCDATRSFYDAQLAPGMVDNQLGTLPLSMYANTGRLHVNDDGAQMVSLMIAAQIVKAEKGELPAR